MVFWGVPPFPAKTSEYVQGKSGNTFNVSTEMVLVVTIIMTGQPSPNVPPLKKRPYWWFINQWFPLIRPAMRPLFLGGGYVARGFGWPVMILPGGSGTTRGILGGIFCMRNESDMLLETKLGSLHEKRHWQKIHPGRLTWNLKITYLKRKIIFQTPMIMFHVNLQGCKWAFSILLFLRIKCAMLVTGRVTHTSQIVRYLTKWKNTR